MKTKGISAIKKRKINGKKQHIMNKLKENTKKIVFRTSNKCTWKMQSSKTRLNNKSY